MSHSSRKKLTQKELWGKHQKLMFNLAFPKNQTIAKNSKAKLSKIAELIKEHSSRYPSRWEDSGVWGSYTEYSYTLPALDWLTHHCPDSIEIVFDEEEIGDEFQTIIAFLISPLKKEGLDSTEISTQTWIQDSCGDKHMTKWIVEKLASLDVPDKIRNYLFEKMSIHIHWKLNHKTYTRTFSRFPSNRTFTHPKGPTRKILPQDVLSKKLPAKTKLTKEKQQQIINCCKFAIYSRCREIDTLNFINKKETHFFQLERGYDLFLFGMKPERRLGLDSYQGFILAKNSIPIAYGGGWVLFDRCEIGVSIFEEFRGGESQYAFLQVMRVYQQHFKINRFTVDGFQFGHNNQEAIDSGAFWFYYHLGFRPSDQKLFDLASREQDKIKSNKRYRTPPNILKRLATESLELTFNKQKEPLLVKVPDLSLTVSKWIGSKHSGNHEKAWSYLEKKLKKIFNLSDFKNWTENEKKSFKFLAPLIYQIKDLKNWSPEEKKNLYLLMKAKGSNNERNFVFMCQKHKKLKHALNIL